MSSKIAFQTAQHDKFEGEIISISDQIARVGYAYPIFLWAWERELFMLSEETFPKLKLAELTSEENIEIELRLKKSFASQLQTSLGETLQHTAQLASESCWVAHTIFQKADTSGAPKDIVGGSVKIGYKSIWHEQASKVATMTDVAKYYFLKRNIPYEEISQSLFRIQMEEENRKWVFLVKADEPNHFCMCYSVFPMRVPQAEREKVAAYLINQNYDLGVGSFEMDMEDGEVRLRTSLDVEGDRLSEANLNQLMTLNIGTFLRFYEELEERISSTA